jgi:hypothetical protein
LVEREAVTSYWVAVNGKQIELPFNNLEAAKQLLLERLGEHQTALGLIEVYDGDHPMRKLLWDAEIQDWIEVPHPTPGPSRPATS